MRTGLTGQSCGMTNQCGVPGLAYELPQSAEALARLDLLTDGRKQVHINLGTPVVPLFPFYFGASLLKLSSWKKGTLIIMGLLGNLVTAGRIPGPQQRAVIPAR